MLCCDLGSLEPSPLISQHRTLLSQDPAMRNVALTDGGEKRRHCTESSAEEVGCPKVKFQACKSTRK